eukprot:m.84737 g.84737  ORF g.84737 m.84737 type:complete len:192 (+) comp25796_c0_seq1:152-727(+)
MAQKTEEEELEDLFDEIDIPAEIRDARYAAVKDYQKYASQGGGQYEEIDEEREVLDRTAKDDRCVVHFMHPGFRTCAIMKEHLTKIAHNHFRTRFYAFNADKGRWIANKLNIKVLPSVLCFIGGKVKDRVIGFEDFNNSESFETKALEERLAQCGVIHIGGAEGAASTKIFGNFASSSKNDDSDDYSTDDD